MAEWEALWPLKRMPVLVDEGRLVAEASIIIEHLGLFHPGLVPDDPRAALDVRFMDRFFDNYVMAPTMRIVFDAIRLPEKTAARRMSWKRGRSSTWRIAGSMAACGVESGRAATRSRWPTARPRRRCSMPTGCIRSARHTKASGLPPTTARPPLVRARRRRRAPLSRSVPARRTEPRLGQTGGNHVTGCTFPRNPGRQSASKPSEE